MSLLPEQTRALSYVRRKGTEATLASIRRSVAGTFGDLETLLGALPEDVVRKRPGPSRWSVHEIVDHLAVTHDRAVAELAGLIAGVVPASGPIPAGLVSKDPFAKSWSDVLAELESVHRRFLGALDEATDRTSLDVRAPVVMVVKRATPTGETEPVEWVESFDWKAYAVLFRIHTLEHVQQIQRTAGALR